MLQDLGNEQTISQAVKDGNQYVMTAPQVGPKYPVPQWTPFGDTSATFKNPQ
jgi:hypothetical protein